MIRELLIFLKNNDDTWGQQDTTITTLRKENVKILPSIDATTDASLKSNGFFGYDVAISQDVAIVSAVDKKKYSGCKLPFCLYI